MQFNSDNLYHIYNQGNNKRALFHSEIDYVHFLKLIRQKLLPQCEIVCYCIMPNHFHLMIYCDDRVLDLKKQGGLLLDPITNAVREVLSIYARYYNKTYDSTGSLFRQKTKYKLLTDPKLITTLNYNLNDYCTACFNYIHQNPLKAGLVNDLKEWKFSSYPDYAGIRKGSLCNKSLAKKYCNYDLKTFEENIVTNIEDEFLDTLLSR